VDQASAHYATVLQQAAQLLGSGKDSAVLLQQLLLILRNHAGAQRAAVFMLNGSGDQLVCRAQHGLRPEDAGAPLLLKDNHGIALAVRTRVSQMVTAPGGSLQDLVTPMTARDGVLGALLTGTGSEQGFGPEEMTLISLLAAETAVVLENLRLQNAERVRFRQLELLRLMARSAATTTEPAQLYATLAELLGDSFEGAQVALVLSPPQGDLSLAACAGTETPPMERLLQSRQSGLLGQALRQRAPLLVEDCAANPAKPPCFLSSGTELYVPLVGEQGALGVLLVAHKEARSVQKDDLSLAQAAADIAATAVRNLRLTAELQRLTSTDALTNCYNQRHFQILLQQEMSRAHRYHKPFGMLMLDLRGLGEINSTVGMESGDRLLQQVAHSMRTRLRSHDTLARYVADRFVMLLPEVDAEGVTTVLSKLHGALQRIEVRFPSGPRSLSASWAAVTYPQDGTNEGELLKLLLTRLDQAKAQGRGKA
jgi:diguanylate cyclase (GGDEF)-like protein